jgi:zinc/manganese transport system permease protein
MEAWETMKLPLLACLLLPALLVYLGLHIVRRGIIFVDLALAQVAALGTCWCVMLGHDPHDIHTYWWSIAFTLAGALIFTFTRTSEPHRVPQEALDRHRVCCRGSSVDRAPQQVAGEQRGIASAR